jgi:1,2-phenylacetyl-CoA epoxidase PaaB subunit
MIAHKHFAEQGVLHASDKREALRMQVEAFINQEIRPEQVMTITETYVSMNNVFSITIWYRQD